MNDLRYTLSQLAKSSGLTSVAVLTISLATIALPASYISVLRATRADPMIALSQNV